MGIGERDSIIFTADDGRGRCVQCGECAKQGDYSLYSQIAYPPPLDYVGWQGECEVCQARKRAQELNPLNYSGIPRFYQGKSFADWKTDTPLRKQALDTAQGYVESFAPGRNLIIVGDPGSGRTLLLSIVLQELLKRPWELKPKQSPVAYCNCIEFFAGIYELRTSAADYRYERNRLTCFDTDPVLGFDDCGASTEEEQVWLFAILGRRRQEIRSTVLTGSSESDLQQMLGPQLWLRVSDGASIVRLSQPSEESDKRACKACGAELSGKQELYCSHLCRVRDKREQEKLKKLEAVHA